MRLENKVALITGGYGAMGRASARLFAKEGATVFVAGRDRGRGDALVAEITDSGGKRTSSNSMWSIKSSGTLPSRRSSRRQAHCTC